MFSIGRKLSAVAVIAAATLLLAGAAGAQTFGCVSPESQQSRPIYMINPGPVGDCTDCLKDMDGDLVEYLDFLAEHGLADRVQCFVGDAFGNCTEGVPHGEIVVDYFTGFGPAPVQVNLETSVADLIDDMVAGMTAAGAIGNLCVSDGLTTEPDPILQAAITNAFNAGMVLVGVPPAFGAQQKAVGDQYIQIFKEDQFGGTPGDGSVPVNTCALYFAGMWDDPATGNLIIANPHSALNMGQTYPDYDFTVGGYTDSGSFITPTASGSMAAIMAIVENRGLTGTALSAQTIDYIVSGSDHPDGSFAVVSGLLTSYAPWSPTWKYGLYNPWKALMYASGYGRIASQDRDLYGTTNPVTSFNDDFELRGDLSVEPYQYLTIGEMASVQVVTPVPEGPNYGDDAARHEIRVDGGMSIEGSVESSLIVGTGSTVTVTGSLTIGQGQKLTVEFGGYLVIQGGTLVVEGETDIQGSLICESDATLVLRSDLDIAESGYLTAHTGSLIAVGDTDLAGAGIDPAEVEIACAGTLLLVGAEGALMPIRAEEPGVGDWYGIVLDSASPAASVLAYVEVGDAATGLDVAGTSPLSFYNNTFIGNTFGVSITGRNGDQLILGTFTGSDVGLVLEDADPSISQCTLADNLVGIHCGLGARPTVRGSTISNNLVGVRVVDAGSLPNLGTDADPGNNQILSPLKNQLAIAAFDLSSDIMAQHNWWGTTRTSTIAKKISIINSTRQVVFLPLLSSPPAMAAADPDEPGPAIGQPADSDSGTVLSFVAGPARTAMSGTVLQFRTPEAGHVKLSVYDLRGRMVSSLLDETLPQGLHSVVWDGKDSRGGRAASGVYFARISTGKQFATTKLVIAH